MFQTIDWITSRRLKFQSHCTGFQSDCRMKIRSCAKYSCTENFTTTIRIYNNGPVNVNQKIAFFRFDQYQFGLEPKFWKAVFENFFWYSSSKSNNWEIISKLQVSLLWVLQNQRIKSTIARKVNWKLKTLCFSRVLTLEIPTSDPKLILKNRKTEKLNCRLSVFKAKRNFLESKIFYICTQNKDFEKQIYCEFSRS